MSSKIQALIAPGATRNRPLEELPGRALTLIKGIARSPSVRALMNKAGYTVAIQEQGFQLLEAASGYGTNDEGAPAGDPSTNAIRAVSSWFDPAFDRIQAALAHLHPEQEAYVFHGLVKVPGVASVVAAHVLLDRLGDLQGTGPNAAARQATADADKKAMATLADRGFDAKELDRVRGLVETAHVAVADIPDAPVDEDAQTKRLLALKAWYDDWATTARSVVTKRADLIHLGLAHKRVGKGDVPAEAAPAGSNHA